LFGQTIAAAKNAEASTRSFVYFIIKYDRRLGAVKTAQNPFPRAVYEAVRRFEPLK
jgi:hypothetical protein